MRKLEDLSTDLALYDTMTRLARLILRHVVPHHPLSTEGEHTLKLIHDLHDESLARMVGSVRQVVNRHLQHWRKQGVLHKQSFHTEVRKLEILQDYANDAYSHSEKKNKIAALFLIHCYLIKSLPSYIAVIQVTAHTRCFK